LFFALASQKSCFLEAEVSRPAGNHLSNDQVIKEVDLQDPRARQIPSVSWIRLAMAEQPGWQPISRLPLIGPMIDGMLQDAEALPNFTASFSQKGRIEKVLAKSDLELGLEFLPGKKRPPH
jgi:hypothetical protein